MMTTPPPETLDSLKERLMKEHNFTAITPSGLVDIVHAYLEWRKQNERDTIK
jgi:hypothetical protein